MENKFIERITVSNCELRLEERVSKKGTTYKACVLVCDGVEKIIGFDIDYYSMRKKLYKDVDKEFD